MIAFERLARPATTERRKLADLWAERDRLPKLSKVRTAWLLYLQALRSMLLSPMTSLLTMATIAISLSLFSGFVLILTNIRDLITASEGALSISVYLRDGAPQSAVDQLLQKIRSESGANVVTFRSKQEALKSFRDSLAERASVLDGLESENPLPASFEVRFGEGASTTELFDHFAEKFSHDPIVEDIQYSAGSLSQLRALVGAFKTGGLVAVLFMLLMTGFIISNTIRLGLFSHRDEIDIMQLVGATPAFIKAPYVIEGCVQGGIGALLGVAILFGFYSLVRDVVTGSPILSLLFPGLHFLSLNLIVLIAFLGIIVGITGSYLAVRRFIKL